MPKKIKILLIEDDTFLLGMYSVKFEHEGFEVVIADDGEKGWDLAQAEHPDIVLLDIMLPKMNGFDILRNMKNDQALSATPVILLTNLNQKAEIDQGIALGADDFLIKAHYTPTEVVKKINEVLKKRGVI